MFTLENYITTLWWIYSTSTSSVWKRGWSVPFSVPCFSNTQWPWVPNEQIFFSLLLSIMTPTCEWKNTEWNEKSQAIKKHKLKYRKWWNVEAKLAGSPRRRVPCCHSDFKSVLVKKFLFKICLVCLMIHILSLQS